MFDLQRAGWGKRIMAAIFDGILFATLAVGIAALLSFSFGYDIKVEQYAAIMSSYEQQYDVDLEASTENMTPDEQTAHQEKVDAVYNELTQLKLGFRQAF